MPIKTPQYYGTYDRVFLPPVLLIGLGRFGAEVCHDFFGELQTIFRITPQAGRLDTGLLTLKDLIATVALVRAMDETELPLQWAAPHVYCWDPQFDTDSGDRFKIAEASQVARFWAPPTKVFRDAAAETLAKFGPQCAQLMASVSNETWRSRRERLGLPRIENLDQVPKLVIAVGSLCEPDVAALIPHLRNWTMEHVVLGDPRCINFALLDCGLPGHPDYPDQTWLGCPGSIAAQLLSNIRTIRPAEACIPYILTGSTVGGIDMPVRVRAQIMSGILKGFLLSTLCRRNVASPGHGAILLERQAMSQRTSVYVEATLNLDNLADLAVRAVLSTWRSRLSALVEIVDLDQIEARWSKLTSGDWNELIMNLTLSCARATVKAASAAAVERFIGWVEEKHQQILDELAAMAERTEQAPPPAPPAPRGFLDWILRLLGLARKRTPTQAGGLSQASPDRRSARASLDKIEQNYSRLIRCLNLVLPFVREMLRSDSDFADARHDRDDFDTERSDNVVLIRYRRIPPDACPPGVRKFVQEQVEQVDRILFNLLVGSSPALPLISLVKTQLAERFAHNAADTSEADSIRDRDGIIAWLHSDPQLCRFVADFACYRLAPLWRPLPLRNSNWKGFLSVFEYGGRGPQDIPDDFTRNALDCLFDDMRPVLQGFAEPGTQKRWLIGVCPDEQEAQLESWPFYRSIGFLWTERPLLGRGFGDDFDATQLLVRDQKWRDRYPEEAEWVPFANTTAAAAET